MKNFSELTKEEQTEVFNRYVVPTKTENIVVADNGQAFEKNKGLIGLTLKKSAIYDKFHNYSGQQERVRV